jgi:hypothetical protein
MSSRITVKKNLIIFHHPGDWSAIYAKILKDFGMGMAVRTRLRRELGFTYRNHQEWIQIKKMDGGHKYCEQQVHVDFYTESAQSWFQLRYLNCSTEVLPNVI